MYSELNGIRGIYQISSINKPDRIYIGHSVNIGKRWRDHIRDLFLNKHGCHKLQNHYNKYGLNDLVFSLILLCDDVDLVTDEQYFIDTLKPYFNECPTARSCLGIKRNPSVGRKISKSKTGMKYPPVTAETRKKLSESGMGHEGYWLNRKFSAETNNKISVSLKKSWASGQRNRSLSEDHKMKIRKSMIEYHKKRKGIV
jgi:group I intron endonuclease